MRGVVRRYEAVLVLRVSSRSNGNICGNRSPRVRPPVVPMISGISRVSLYLDGQYSLIERKVHVVTLVCLHVMLILVTNRWRMAMQEHQDAGGERSGEVITSPQILDLGYCYPPF